MTADDRPNQDAPKKAPRDGAREGWSYRVASLPQKKPTRFDYRPDAAECAEIATGLGLLELPALRLKGELRPVGQRDFELVADLTATAVQPSAVTLSPVSTPISESIQRRYLADFAYPEGEETEMPEDDSSEPLPEVIDIAAVAAEALSLALPLYPRTADEELGEAIFTEPGSEPLRQEDLKPFAGLAGLAEKLRQSGADKGDADQETGKDDQTPGK